MRNIFFAIALAFNYSGYCQGKDVRIDYRLVSDKYVENSFSDSLKNADYGGAGTFSKKIKNNRKFPKGKLSVVVDTSKVVKFYNDYNGYRLYVANTTRDSVSVTSFCGGLHILAQAYIDSKWQFIEWHGYMCGNCLGWDDLKGGHYWEFTVPKFAGEIKTKMRYSLHLADGAVVYSNELDAGINRGQVANYSEYGAEWVIPMKK